MPVPEGKKRKLSASSDTGGDPEVTSPVVDLEDRRDDLERGQRIVGNLVNALTKALSWEAKQSQPKSKPASAEDILQQAGIVINSDEHWSLESYGLGGTDRDTLVEQAARYRDMNVAPDAFMSADNFDGMFDTILRNVSILREGGVPMLVNAVLLRVAAMLEENGCRLLIIPKYKVSSTDLRGPNETCTVRGTLDYLVVLVPENEAGNANSLLISPICVNLILEKGCFAVMEAKRAPDGSRSLSDALPEAVLHAAALTKRFKLTRMYGAVTDGIDWQFFVFTPGPDGVGGTCERTLPVSISPPDSRAAITGVIKDLVERALVAATSPTGIAPPAPDVV
ncbi:hypothetical protein C8Q76DRAFT_197596 [Earliella scabrosa]|nr:hypothetical protein C8Q76DRAFT_197596 [Earliella scabrosa]